MRQNPDSMRLYDGWYVYIGGWGLDALSPSGFACVATLRLPDCDRIQTQRAIVKFPVAGTPKGVPNISDAEDAPSSVG